MTESPSSGGVGEASLKIMKKKTYIKPEIEVAELAVESPMLTTSEPELGFNPNIEVDTEKDQLSIGRGTRRGKWGNLWYVED